MTELIAGKYEVIEVVGRGGMGTVYKALQRNLDRVVAVKMLSEELAADVEFRARFQQEATLVARLSHPNIVSVYDIEPHNHTFCIIMEFLEGENLQQKINRELTLPEKEVAMIGAQVARALHHAHNHGVVHRDIKPDNIHVTAKGETKVMDFGIARFRESKLKTQTGISMGTPKFMSPEQVTGKNIDAQTDLYSLGVCLYYCLAGRVPFDGENAISIATRHLYEPPAPPSEFNPAITPAMEAVVMRALEKTKSQRYETGTELAEALEAAVHAKSPIRLTQDLSPSDIDATRKMAVASAAVGAATGAGVPGGDTAPVPITPITPSTPRTPAARTPGRAGETSRRLRSISDLDDFMYDPSNDSPATANARNLLRYWWPTVAAVVLVGTGLVFAMLRSREPVIGQTPRVTQPTLSPRDAELDRLRRESRVVAPAKVNDLLKEWAEFQQRHGKDYSAEEVERCIDLVRSRLPLEANKRELARRRSNKGMTYYNAAEPNYGLAKAYLSAADKIGSGVSPNGGKIKLIVYELNKLKEAPDPNRVQEAKATFERAGQLAPAEREHELKRAIASNPWEIGYWEALAQCYLESGYTDDARVIYYHIHDNFSGTPKADARRRLEQLDDLKTTATTPAAATATSAR